MDVTLLLLAALRAVKDYQDVNDQLRARIAELEARPVGAVHMSDFPREVTDGIPGQPV